MHTAQDAYNSVKNSSTSPQNDSNLGRNASGKNSSTSPQNNSNLGQNDSGSDGVARRQHITCHHVPGECCLDTERQHPRHAPGLPSVFGTSSLTDIHGDCCRCGENYFGHTQTMCQNCTDSEIGDLDD